MFKKTDTFIEFSFWGIMAFILYKYIPKNKLREAQLAFLFKQLMTWLFGLYVVEKGYIEYPKRLFFKKANRTSFTFEYFIYPAICSLFNVYYPEKKGILAKVFHNVIYTLFIVIPEIFLEKYTNLINYKKWTWYWSFITIFITNCISRIYFKWFFKY